LKKKKTILENNLKQTKEKLETVTKEKNSKDLEFAAYKKAQETQLNTLKNQYEKSKKKKFKE